jgi:hypothetical protein
VRNSVFWGGGGTDPDIHGEGAAGATVAYVATAQALSGSGNLLLQDDPFELLSPGARLFLNQSRSTPPSVLDAGLDAFADDTEVGFSALGLSPWQELSTAAIGSDDVDTVDLGRHYAPSAGADRIFQWTAVPLGTGANTITATGTSGTMTATDTVTWMRQ